MTAGYHLCMVSSAGKRYLWYFSTYRLTKGSSLFKKQFDIKNQFCTDKGKKIQSHATPTRKEIFVGTVVVSNSVSKEFGVKETRSSSTLLAKALAKTG